jgi:DNA-binding transcriptional LysR family regulator
MEAVRAVSAGRYSGKRWPSTDDGEGTMTGERIPQRILHLRIDRLQSFLAVCQQGSFSGAAQMLFLSQPHVSRHIAELEQALGSPLFDRTLRPIGLTEQGRILEPTARAIVGDLSDVFYAIEGSFSDVVGTVVVGMYPGTSAHLFAAIVQSLAESHPGIDLVLWEAMPHELEPSLLLGTIDVIVRPLSSTSAATRSLEQRELWREPLVAVVKEGDPLASITSGVRLQDLASRPLITIGNPSHPISSQQEVTEAVIESGIDPHIAVRTAVPQTLVALASVGLGVGLTNWLNVQYTDLTGLVVIPIVNEGSERRVVVQWRPTEGRNRETVLVVVEALLQVPSPYQD